MARGGHFFSDVIWYALLAWGGHMRSTLRTAEFRYEPLQGVSLQGFTRCG